MSCVRADGRTRDGNERPWQARARRDAATTRFIRAGRVLVEATEVVADRMLAVGRASEAAAQHIRQSQISGMSMASPRMLFVDEDLGVVDLTPHIVPGSLTLERRGS